MANENTRKRPGGPGGPRGMFAHGKPKNTGKTILRLCGYLVRFWPLILISVICIALTTLGTVYATSLIGVAIDKYISVFDFTGLWRICLELLLIYLTASFATWLYSYLMLKVGQETVATLRREIFEKFQRLPLKYFDKTTHGELMSRVTNDVDNISMCLNSSISQILQSILTVIGTFAMMLYLSIPLTIATIVTIPLMLLVTKWVTSHSRKYFKAKQEELGKLNGHIEEIISGQKVVKVFCHEEENIEKFKEINNNLYESAYNANAFANVIGPINAQLGNVSYVLVALVGGILALEGVGGFTLGKLASFLTFNKSFSQPINQVSQQFNSIVMALAGAERIFNLMDEEVEQDNGDVTLVNVKYDRNDNIVETEEKTYMWAWKEVQKDGSVKYTRLTGEVKFFDVDFGYNPEKIVLHDITLYADHGEKVAFVGATGAGKTTITNLINRFYDIADGTITYDGININRIKKKDLRRSLGIVLQDTNLFTGTIKENIRYGNLDATDEEVYAAARLANADEFINMLPDGYDTVISGDGGSLSQGQRQLLSIARAAVADPPVMILDEATSALDIETEERVLRNIMNKDNGRTCIVTTHRPSVLSVSDHIYEIKSTKLKQLK